MTRSRIIVVQAMNSTTEDHWYGTFEHRLRSAADVAVPAMPTPLEPDAEAWQGALDASIGDVGRSTLIVAHSVGNAAVLQYLSRLPTGWVLGGLVNVAGFSEPQPGNDATIPFTQGIDHELVRDSTLQRHAVISTNDPEIPAALTSELARRLDSTVHRVDGAGHFRGSDGYRELPLVEQLAIAWAGQMVATEPESTR